MELIRTAHEHGVITECEEMPNYFGYETTVHNSTTTQIWFIEDEGIEKCTSISVHKHAFSPTGEVTIEIIAPSFNGTATEMETRIEVLQFAMAIANAH
tara:strand:+ start:1541 stop:1834 length:294 start_codon:yes stop_codon:yes gene_type:complete